MRFIFNLILLCNFSLFSQVLDFKKNSIQVQIHNSELLLHKKYALLESNDSIVFSNIKFYISDPLIFKNDSLIASLVKRYHLVDLNNPESLVLQTETENFDKIQFNLGIDKQTNLDGVKGGDLDPLKGMYWTWNTIFCQIYSFESDRNKIFSLLNSLGGLSQSRGYLHLIHFLKTSSPI